MAQYDAAATDLRDFFTSTSDFTPCPFQPVRYAQNVKPLWLAVAKGIDFSRPDADESRLHDAIMRSEGLPRAKGLARK